MTDLTFRTTDGTKGGAGKGSDLDAVEVDLNFWWLYSHLNTLIDNPPAAINISGFTTVGSQFYVNMDDHSTFGPYQLPIAKWNPRGEWQALTAYSEQDLVTVNNTSVYLVLFNHTSASTFDPGANDGMGHDYYGLLFVSGGIPSGGTVGQILVKQSVTNYDALWVNNPFELVIACSDQTSALTTGTAKETFRVPVNVTLTEVRASLTTAQAAGLEISIDIRRFGTSILSTKLSIDNTERTSLSAATPAVISNPVLSSDDEISIDILTVDAATTAAGLKITLIGYRT